MNDLVRALGWLAAGELDPDTGRRWRALVSAVSCTGVYSSGLAEGGADYVAATTSDVSKTGDAAITLLTGLAGAAMAAPTADNLAFGDAPLVRPALADRPRDAAEILLTAMIAATKVNAPLDRNAERRLLSRLESVGADPSSLAFVAATLAAPPDIDDMLDRIRDTRTAIEVYLASALAIEANNPDGRTYLDRLSSRIGLQKSTRDRIDGWLGHA